MEIITFPPCELSSDAGGNKEPLKKHSAKN